MKHFITLMAAPVAALMAAALFLTGCVKFEINDHDQWPVVKSGKISKKEFDEKIKGHGWDGGLTYRIVNGKVTNEVMDEMNGFRSADYYFDEGILTKFISPDHIPASGYYVRPYEYNESDCSVYINGYKSFTIVKVTNNKFEIIDQTGVKSDGTKTFGYRTYTLMSEEELAKTRKEYSTDLDSVSW